MQKKNSQGNKSLKESQDRFGWSITFKGKIACQKGIGSPSMLTSSVLREGRKSIGSDLMIESFYSM